MEAGDRVMVFDSQGFPSPHYLYATVLAPSEKGALVIVDHPGNVRHGQQTWVANEQIMRAGDAKAKAAEFRAQAAADTDPDRRKTLLEHAKGQEFVATQLAE